MLKTAARLHFDRAYAISLHTVYNVVVILRGHYWTRTRSYKRERYNLCRHYVRHYVCSSLTGSMCRSSSSLQASLTILSPTIWRS